MNFSMHIHRKLLKEKINSKKDGGGLLAQSPKVFFQEPNVRSPSYAEKIHTRLGITGLN